ncbi:MAG: hypothetical protein K0Q93_398 [Nocardioidaceae bacterium]|nr:hypothetical protein [Nocardioidaceae bacterium]
MRGRGVALVVAAGLALTACGDVSPGAAATVDGTKISRETVDEMAQAVCTAEVTYAGLVDQPVQPTPTSIYRELSLSLLINEQLALDVADRLDIDVPPSSYQAGQDAGLEGLFEALPSSALEPFQDYVESYNRLQALYAAIGTEVGEASGDTPQAAAEAGRAYVAQYAEQQDITVDPRFGGFTDGRVAGGSGSLSVPVDAAAGVRPGEPPDVSGLPDSQICQ